MIRTLSKKHNRFCSLSGEIRASIQYLKIAAFFTNFLITTFIMTEENHPENATSIFDFAITDIDGEVFNLENYRGHVCVIVNVASL